MEKILYDSKELAVSIGVKVPTVRRWVCYSPDIPVVRIGRLIRFKIAEVLTWIEQGGPQRVNAALAAARKVEG